MKSAPEVSWAYPLTGMTGLLVMDPATPGTSYGDKCSEPMGADYLEQTDDKWGMTPFVYALPDGQRLVLHENAAVRYGRIDPERPEPQEVHMAGKSAEARISLRVWEKQLPARIGEPSFADIDGDGLGELLVICRDGNLYCLDDSKPE